MRALPLAVLALLVTAAPAAADCCSYVPPVAGALVAAPGAGGGAWLAYDGLKLDDDRETHGGGVAVLLPDGLQRAALPTADPAAGGAGLPALAPDRTGARVAWGTIPTNASRGPGTVASLGDGTTLRDAGPMGELPAAGAELAVQPDGQTLVVYRAGDALQSYLVPVGGSVSDVVQTPATLARGVTDFRLVAGPTLVYVEDHRLIALDLRPGTVGANAQQDLGPARRILAAAPGTGAPAGDGVQVVVDDAGATRRYTADLRRVDAAQVAAPTAELLSRKGRFRPSAALDGDRVTYLATGRSGNADVLTRTTTQRTARNLTRTSVGESYVGGQAGGVAVYGRARALFARRLTGAEIPFGPAQPRATAQVRVAADGAGAVWVAYVGIGKADARDCGALVVSRLMPARPTPRPGRAQLVAECAVGTSV